MGICRKNLEIHFRNVDPEVVLMTLKSELEPHYNDPDFKPKQQSCSALKGLEKAPYREWALPVTPTLSSEQFELHRQTANDVMDRYEKEHQSQNNNSSVSSPKLNVGVFALLVQYTAGDSVKQGVLDIRDGQPVCKYNNILNWQTITNILGQDLFTTAYLAYNSVKYSRPHANFLYSAIIKTDYMRLNNFFNNKDFCENHFHLMGSARAFQLNWITLMNNTEEIPRHKYEELHFFLGDNPDNFRNVSEFMKATEKAALIRASLFEYLKECERNSSFVSNDNSLDKAYELYKNLDDLMILNKLTVKTTRLRFQHGFQIAEYDDAVLDYAMTSDIVRPGDENYHNRSLAGERAFLYNCFKAIFSGQLNSVYKELFYYYLIVKSRVQSEFVQSNKRYGFDNFARYTHRKLSLVPQSLQLIYRKEMVIQTLACSKHELHLKNLEIRVTPDNKTGKNIKWLSDIATWFNRYESITGSGSGYYYCWLRDTRQALSDPQDNSNSLVEWMLRSENQFNRLPNDFISVVYHFIKEVDKFDPKTGNYQSFPCRHYKLRNKIEVQAYALQQSLEYDNNRNQIRGIDAASSEVTCRPEVFASAFRFLSKLRFTFHSRIYDFSNSQRSDTLSRTFHAGEDFHDLCSGLRAMDEAVLFLGLKENDRIGHGMALGLSPVEYYTKNGGHISLPTQEMFDNIVWLICRSRELNVIIPPMVREILENKFHELLSNLTAKLVTNSDNSSSDNDIIHKSDIASFPIRDFYDAWQLRGDNPLLYMNVSALSTVPQDSPLDKYHTKNPEVLDYVRTPHARRIYNIYHYDRSFREAGKINTEFKADKNFMTFVTEIQTALLKQFEQKHIAIECCPTSNILISNFERYDNHPILHLSDVSGNYSAAKLSVSLNTDDQGVFQTDLMNEYALIASALERKTDENGERLYSSETIFEWLDRVREHSVNQMF